MWYGSIPHGTLGLLIGPRHRNQHDTWSNLSPQPDKLSTVTDGQWIAIPKWIMDVRHFFGFTNFFLLSEWHDHYLVSLSVWVRGLPRCIDASFLCSQSLESCLFLCVPRVVSLSPLDWFLPRQVGLFFFFSNYTVIHFYFGSVQFSVKRKFAVLVQSKFR